MISSFRIVWHLTYKTVVGWFEDSAPRHGAAIAYCTLFALAPVLLVVSAIAGLVLGEDVVRGEIVGQLTGLVGRDDARAIQGILQRASEPREGAAATTAGTTGLLIATNGAFLESWARWRLPCSSPSDSA